MPIAHTWDLDPGAGPTAPGRTGIGKVDTSTPLGPWQDLAAADVSFDRGGETLYRGGGRGRRRQPFTGDRAGRRGQPGDLPLRPRPPVVPRGPRPSSKPSPSSETRPDVVLCDGQGIAHPSAAGIASHLGLWLDLPTVGCAKSRLLAARYDEPGPNRGDRSPLIDRGRSSGPSSGPEIESPRCSSRPGIGATSTGAVAPRPGHDPASSGCRSRPGWPTNSSTRLRREAH